MYQFLTSKDMSKNVTTHQKRSGQTVKPLHTKPIKDTDGLFNDTRLTSDKQNANPCLYRGVSDNHVLQLKSVAQMANGVNSYIGEPKDWHIHCEKHIKYRSVIESRVIFDHKGRDEIFEELNNKIARCRLNHTTENNENFRICITWINTHI